jgi:hypothetical protein
MDTVQKVNSCINQQEINKQVIMTMKQKFYNVHDMKLMTSTNRSVAFKFK